MRVLFLCGSLAEGRDGVGDYTRVLAAECVRQGHSCALVALHDRHTDEVISKEEARMLLLRLPAALGWPERVGRARALAEEFGAEWISLQFVPYAFDDKGLVWRLARDLRSLLAGRPLHLMFHELWLGRELGWSGRQRLVGTVQRAMIRSFLKAARPRVVHTSNPAYVTLLERAGVAAKLLPLFGAIPLQGGREKSWMEGKLQAAFGTGFTREEHWLFGLFGALHPQWPAEPLLTQLQSAAQAAGKRAVLLAIGRLGAAGLVRWEEVVQEAAGRVRTLALGAQSAAHVSEYLSELEAGIATTPPSIVGKSSTVASMLEHGLPVIVNRPEFPHGLVAREAEEPLLIVGREALAARLRAGLPKGVRSARAPQVAQEFLSSLAKAD